MLTPCDIRSIIHALSVVLLSSGVLPAQDEPQFEELSILRTRFEPLGWTMINKGDGYFYGAATWAPNDTAGLIYRVAPGRDAEVVHRFDEISVGFEPNAGGAHPCTELVPGPDDSLYGATESGGVHGFGVLFRITPDGAFHVLHDLNGSVGISCSSVLPMSDGTIYGTTLWGGPEREGSMFRLGPDGAFEIVYAFKRSPLGAPGDSLEGTFREPHAPISLALGPDGAIYGNTQLGGVYWYGSTNGVFFRYNGPGSITVLSDFKDHGPTRTLEPYDGGFLSTTWSKVLRVGTDGSIQVIADLSPTSSEVNIAGALAVAPDGIYGISTSGGTHGAGFAFRVVPGSQPTVLHHFSLEYQNRDRCLVVGNDAQIYGLAAFPEGYEASASSSVTMAKSAAAKAKPSKAKPADMPRTFRFRRGDESGNLGPVAGQDIAWLPAKASNGQRIVVVPILKNDFDPDGDPLSVSIFDLEGEGTAELVTTSKGTAIRFVTTATDPAGQRLRYRLEDGKGGESTGLLTIYSSVAGTYRGPTAATGESPSVAGDLTVKVTAKHQLNAAFTLGGIRYTGKGRLDGDETADLVLKANGREPLTLRLGLRRDPSRQLHAWINGPDVAQAGTCPIVPKGGR